jgi:hypothetical protein
MKRACLRIGAAIEENDILPAARRAGGGHVLTLESAGSVGESAGSAWSSLDTNEPMVLFWSTPLVRIRARR